jgi:hypothetical protein
MVLIFATGSNVSNTKIYLYEEIVFLYKRAYTAKQTFRRFLTHHVSAQHAVFVSPLFGTEPAEILKGFIKSKIATYGV